MSVARRRERIAAAMPRRRSSSSRPPMPRTPITHDRAGALVALGDGRLAVDGGRERAGAPEAGHTVAAEPRPGRLVVVQAGRHRGTQRHARLRAQSSICRPSRTRTMFGNPRKSSLSPRGPPAPGASPLEPDDRPMLVALPGLYPDRTVPGSEGQSTLNRRVNDQAVSLAREWRRLGRAASIVALFTSPLLYVLLHTGLEWPVLWALLGTIAGIVMFRGAGRRARAQADPGAVALRRRGRAQGVRRRLAAPALVLAQAATASSGSCSSSFALAHRRRDDRQRVRRRRPSVGGAVITIGDAHRGVRARARWRTSRSSRSCSSRTS